MSLAGKGHVRGMGGTTAAWTGFDATTIIAAVNRIYGLGMNESFQVSDLVTSEDEIDGASTHQHTRTIEITGSIIAPSGTNTVAGAKAVHILPAPLGVVAIDNSDITSVDGNWNFIGGGFDLSASGISTFRMTLRQTYTSGTTYDSMTVL